MTERDLARLDRIEAMLAEVLAELRAKRVRAPSRRGARAPAGPVSDEARAEARARLARIGVRVA